MYRGKMMNKFEYLYHKKQQLEKEIAKNDLFKLSENDAIQCVMIKVGMMYSLFQGGDHDKKQEYMKILIGTTATYIDEISFFQESLKWICRWCSKYCSVESKYDIKISAEQVYKLMGLAYAYNEFIKYSFFHSKHMVSYRTFGDSIQFDYTNEKSHQVHELYDTLNRKRSEGRILLDYFVKNINVSGMEVIENIHRSDFSFNYNFNFGKFSLKDYEEISVVLNNHIMRKILNNHVLIPGKEGISI